MADSGQFSSVVEDVTITSSVYSGAPNYDSGWVALALNQAKTLTHNLGGNTNNYVVDMQYRASSVDGVNLRYYGGADFGTLPAPGHLVNDRVGAYWRTLTNTSITVYRRPEDSYAEQVRIRIWVDPQPHYDSGWISLVPGAAATTLTHNLGGNADHYMVDMQYRASGVNGVNQRYFGGSDFGNKPVSPHLENDRVGLYWRSLTNTSITLFRRNEDDYAAQVRVRIWVRPTPTYDSGWVTINQDQALTLSHNLGGISGYYLVDMEYKSGADGINQRYYGGADFGTMPVSGHLANDRVGAYWRSLSATNIVIYRRPEDTYASQVRIRIWQYTPRIPSTYWSPTPPDYDSGWQSLGAAATATTLNHNLGGSTTNYLVDMQYRTSDVNGINLRYYGGADFGTKPAPGHNSDDRVGAYWRSLTNASITVFRRDEDDYAPEVRIRIWVMPAAHYDSGWVALGQNTAQALAHNLGGNVDDYLVDMQYRSPGDGVNQRYYGGADFGAKIAIGSENDRVGAYWRSLSSSSVVVYRRPNDIYAPEIRLRIWRTAPPDYDSGWVAVVPDIAQTLHHQVGDLETNYLVDMLQYDGGGSNGINQRHLGGADFGTLPPLGYAPDDRVGAYWRSLTPDYITIYRRPEDGFVNWLRIRIWNYTQKIYLPVVIQ